MGECAVSHNVKMGLIAIAMIVVILLAGNCAYNAGEWIGRN